MAVKFLFLVIIAYLAQVYYAKDVITIQLEISPLSLQVLNHRDDFGEIMVMSGLEKHLRDLDSYTHICYKKYLEIFKKICKNFSNASKKLATTSKKYFRGKFEKTGKNLSKYLNKMANLTEKYPDTLYKLINEDHYQEAIEYLNEVWLFFELTEAQFLGEVKGLKNNHPEIKMQCEKTTSHYDGYREKAKLKGSDLYEQFERCMESKSIK